MSYELDTASVLRQLGLNPKRHLPENGTTTRTVTWMHRRGHASDTIKARVLSVYAAAILDVTQRTQGQCPHCSRWFALGNLFQHIHGQRKRLARREDVVTLKGCKDRSPKERPRRRKVKPNYEAQGQYDAANGTDNGFAPWQVNREE